MGTSLAVAFAPRRLAHANLWVSDLQRSLGFFRDVCGLVQVFEEPGIGAIFLSNGNSHHDLAVMQAMDRDRIGRAGQVQIPRTVGNHPGLNHLAFEMHTEAELVAAHKRAKDAGMSLRTVDHQISHSVYLHDPDGNYLEFYADASDNWRQVYQNCENDLLTQPWDPEAAEPEQRPLYAESPQFDAVDAAPIHPIRTARAALHVADLDRAVEFYTSVVGLTLLTVIAPGLAILAGTTMAPGIALVAGQPASGLHHFGLEMADIAELNEGRDRLRRAGVGILAEIDKSDKTSVVLADPDGNRVEFFVVRPSSEPFSVPAGVDAGFAL